MRGLKLAALAVLAAIVVLLIAQPALAADEPPEQVQVADAFLELHTGPGRGPVFHVAGRGEAGSRSCCVTPTGSRCASAATCTTSRRAGSRARRWRPR